MNRSGLPDIFMDEETMQTQLLTRLDRRTFVATIATTLAASIPGCESPARFFVGETELQSLDFAYHRSGAAEWIVVTGVPEESEAVFSIAGAAPAPLPASGIIDLPPGLSGTVIVSVRWTKGSLLVRSGFRNQMLDLDEKRQSANASAYTGGR